MMNVTQHRAVISSIAAGLVTWLSSRASGIKYCLHRTLSNPFTERRYSCKCHGKTYGRRSVDHGLGQVSQNLERGDSPPDFVMLQNFKHQITCITM